MELLMAVSIGVLTACGIYLMLRARTFPVVMGLMMLGYAVNLFLFSMGRLATEAPAVIGRADTHADPLPQALVLTAIVIGFAMTAYVVILIIRGRKTLEHDYVDDRVNERDHGVAEQGLAKRAVPMPSADSDGQSDGQSNGAPRP